MIAFNGYRTSGEIIVTQTLAGGRAHGAQNGITTYLAVAVTGCRPLR
jgi:hypothetical protein